MEHKFYRRIKTCLHSEIILVPELIPDILSTFKRNWSSHVFRPMLKRNWRLCYINTMTLIWLRCRTCWRCIATLTFQWRIDVALTRCHCSRRAVANRYWSCIWDFDATMIYWRCIWCAHVKLLTDVALALLIDITHWRYNDARKWQWKLTPLLQ